MKKRNIRQLRRWILFFMLMLLLSGITAIPLEAELNIVTNLIPVGSTMGDWLQKIYESLRATNQEYPFLAYGYDWLAFAHIVLSLLFIGPLMDPVKNKWVIEFGMISCLLIIPFVLIAGEAREIPYWWRMIDCSFGIIGLWPLAVCLRKIREIENIETHIHHNK